MTRKWEDLVNKANLVHSFLSIFIYFLYMFRATVCPSSGEITVLTLGICHSMWMTGMQGGMNLHTRQSSTQSDKYQVSHR